MESYGAQALIFSSAGYYLPENVKERVNHLYLI